MDQMNGVSTIAADTYMFYINLSKTTHAQIEAAQTSIDQSKAKIASLEKDLADEKAHLAALSAQVESLKVKELEVRSIAGELEKQKSQLKSIVVGTAK